MAVIQEWFSQWVGTENLWMLQVFTVVFVTLLAAAIARLLLKHIARKTEQTQTLWDDALIQSVRRPLRWFIWLVGLSYAVTLTGEAAESELFELVPLIRKLGVNLLVAWFLILFIRKAETNLMDPAFTKSQPMDVTTVTAMGKLLRASVIITAALVVLQTFGVSISGVLAFGGIGGLAVGFAAKDMLANFFGGLMVYLDRQFAVGEWIRSPDQDIEGVVEDIGWRLTRIRTFDKRALFVPNATFTHITVENPSRMTNRRIYETVGIRYSDAGRLPAIVEDVKAMLKEHPELDMEQTLIVNFVAFGNSSLDFFLYTFTKTTDWVRFHEIKQDVMFKVLEIIDRHGAECAFPTSTVHVPKGIALETAGPAAEQWHQSPS